MFFPVFTTTIHVHTFPAKWMMDRFPHINARFSFLIIWIHFEKPLLCTNLRIQFHCIDVPSFARFSSFATFAMFFEFYIVHTMPRKQFHIMIKKFMSLKLNSCGSTFFGVLVQFNQNCSHEYSCQYIVHSHNQYQTGILCTQ